MGSIHEKNQRSTISCYCTFNMHLDNFAVDLVAVSHWAQKKGSLGAWSVFTSLLASLARPEGLFTSVKAKKGSLYV
jgi:hypothetical protein